ncbi:MAG TPA: DUF1540 domain-containing protein [Candidatus Intestinimonas stercoravium]|uniref:DUF1540 domain-containing protein n=1 Tax=uncultured Intestinimonas sp. TaxID=1689265 RepID=UPI001F8A4A0C|nr:DUF1540 domain-containing protein [uncultured Intestinimonas sp.]HJA63031.1 DUF1540 domain-containing protein [Candidatus Intestinimonas stercoravium]
MNQRNANPSIACTVNTCAYHCKDQDHCSLSSIRVGCCGAQPMDCASTECASFKKG